MRAAKALLSLFVCTVFSEHWSLAGVIIIRTRTSVLALLFQALMDFIVFKMAVKRNLQQLSVSNDKMRCPEVAEEAVLKESKVTCTAFLKANVFEHLLQ